MASLNLSLASRGWANFVEGFETPYGMELLATVHWVSVRAERPASSVDEAIEAVHAWNDRKRKMFQASHIGRAHGRLVQQGWIAA